MDCAKFPVGNAETLNVAKPNLGSKHQCPKCGVRFYDLGKDSPFVCIDCGHQFREEPILKPRRPVAAPAPAPKPVEAVKPKSDDEDEDDPAAEIEDVATDDDDDDDDIEALLEVDDDDEDDIKVDVDVPAEPKTDDK